MGRLESEPNRVGSETQVEVELTLGFWMGKYEVTQDEYVKIAGTNPAKFKEKGDDSPVEQVSYDEAVAFCEKLNERERKQGNLTEGWAYTLPTEAQWEYACGAGEKEPYSGGTLDEVGWYKDNSGGKTHKVGEKTANAWGLHDMHGNVQEWCLDWHVGKLLGGKDPTGPISGSHRVRRGSPVGLPDYGVPASRNSFLGFRVCLISTSN
jgi:formylglycine-generating enzyme required for sulfatase activity